MKLVTLAEEFGGVYEHFNPHEREARDESQALRITQAESILIHTSVKLVTRSQQSAIAEADILIHTSVKLVTLAMRRSVSSRRF